LKSCILRKNPKNNVTGEAVKKALEMNFEIFLGAILPFLIWRSSIQDHSTRSIYIHGTRKSHLGTFSTVSEGS